MMPPAPPINRVLAVDDDALLLREYLHCLGRDFEPDVAGSTLSDLEKVLFGEDTDEKGAARFDVHTRSNGEAAVRAVAAAVRANSPYAIVFLDIRMPPGIDGVETARRIRGLDPNVNIVLVTGSMSPEPDNLGARIPPADRIFFFKKPFHAVECRQLAAALCGKWHADLALRRANEILEQRVMDRTAELHRLAYFDPVTKLPNRLKLMDELRQIIEAGGEGESAVILLDVERFSFLNETLGYDSGTRLLRALGKRLVDLFDAGGPNRTGIVGRFGADEFAVLVPRCGARATLEDTVERVKTLVQEPFSLDGRDLFLKASIGVARHPVHGRDPATVFRCAEGALHRSMRRPDGSVTYYRRDMRYRAQHRLETEAELRRAIDGGEITVFFQPQVRLADGSLAGVEALARWIRRDGSITSPADFVPLSEEMGISDILFECIMRRVCDAVSRWRSERDWAVPVSVNLSAHQLRNGRLVGLVQGILEQHRLGRQMINLELTETALLEDLTVARPVLCELAALGVGIHIDDFGTGYSSLAYLAELPAQTLKIDQSFVERLVGSASNERVVQAIIALGKAMGLEVVAEGIETRQQLEAVRRFGCDLGQGFFIQKPLPEAEFLGWCGSERERRASGR